MSLQQVVKQLEALANPKKVEFKKNKFGIEADKTLGIYHKDLKVLAKEIGQNDKLAHELYDTGIYEARILCSKICDPASVTEEQMDTWAGNFENWEICDSFCMGVFSKSKHALSKAGEWSKADREFVKRAGFTIMAAYGFADKKSDNEVFENFFHPIEREAHDGRLYVKKAVNWALRNVGKRNIDLQKRAIEVANRILLADSKSAKWIASNALTELKKPGANVLDYPRHVYRPVKNIHKDDDVV
ncbi:MAG: 3-methyladenine DNA glycosylase AlkD [Candidatus Azotimanducaceae bacterium]|jgi:3-methyladenine DNA glycosylase AlkD